MKKGWLIKQLTSERDWKKHWFVLTGNSLRYYKDAKAEETNTLDGRIDLSTCYDIVEVSIGRNYGFRIKARKNIFINFLSIYWDSYYGQNFLYFPFGSHVDLQLHVLLQSVPITTKVVSSNPAHGEMYLIQHYVMNFVSDLC